MSVAATSADPGTPKRGRKKLWIIAGIVVLTGLLLAAGVAGWSMWRHQRAVAAEEADEGAGTAAASTAAEDATPAEKPATRRERAVPPVYVPLEPFVVNLADRDADRYAQVGITLEVDDPEFAEEMKAYLPSIRNSILLILSHKSAAEMLDRHGKEQLAAEIAREAVRPMGIDIVPDAAELAASGKPRKRRAGAAAVHNPVRRVHFSSFIVQ